MTRICITQLGRIGDMILLTPAIGAIASEFPDASINVIAGRHNYEIVEGNPRVNNIIIFDKSPTRLPGTIVSLRREKYDYYIDPKDHYSTESRIIVRLIHAGEKIGYNPPGRKNFDISIPGEEDNRGLHIVERHFRALFPLGIDMPAQLPRPELFPDADSEEYAEHFYESTGKNLIIINISASQPKKMWPPEKWIEFIRRIDTGDAGLALSFAPDEATAAGEIAAACDSVAVFRSRSMADVISLIKRCRLLISPDTSLVHVAAAFDRPLVAMFAGLEDFNRKFMPLCSRSELVYAEPGVPGIGGISVAALAGAYEKIAPDVL
jgi:ADP-heptose:LPS heptosyltransferase